VAHPRAPVGWLAGPGRSPDRHRLLTTPEQRPVPLSAFTVDAATALAGPEWLQARRASAAEAFAQAELPSAQEEVWRYSRIGDLRLDSFTPSPDAVRVDLPVPQEWLDQGVTVRRAADLAADGSGLGSVSAGGPDVFATLNDAYSADPIVITVPRGVQLRETLIVGTHLSGDGAVGFPRLVVVVGEGAAATVIERTTSSDEGVLSVPLTELRVERGGRLDFVAIQQLGQQAWQLGSLVADVGQEANLRVGLIGLGGSYARLRTDCTLSGRGATGDLLAAYFGDGDQTLDFRTFQHHDAPDTTSNLLFKGAVGGRSRSVYTGLIRVSKEARGTNAFQTNRNVKLSDEAWAESVPNLEIETNDVRCSHASTVGPVDPEQRFYLESRGVPPTIADRLIVAGFFDEVVRQLPDPSLVTEVSLRIAEKLDRVADDLR
jgi:Fe-S cluster assembly protein SufD